MRRLAFLFAACALAQQNDPARVELFRDRGFGLFIHWSVDNPLGGVISHSLVGASPDFVERFFNTLTHFRRIATRFDKLARNFLAAVLLASIRLWTRAYESTT